MPSQEMSAKIEAVRMMAGHNQFTIEGCGWLAELCEMAKANQELIAAAFEAASHINHLARPTTYAGQALTPHPYSERIQEAAWKAHLLALPNAEKHAAKLPIENLTH